MTEAPPRVPGYVVEGLLGEGGAARVWAAVDAGGRPVALKIPRDGEAARIEREARLLSRVGHPGVPRLHGTTTTADGRAALVLERVRGASLAGRGPVPPAEAWRLVRGAAEVVAAAHAAGVLHRDLSPANLLLDESGRVRVLDFGLGRAEGDASRSGAVVGTPAYLAPERWWGAPADVRTDVYGLAAVLYDLLAGRPPWAGDDPGAVLHTVATGAPPPVGGVAAEVEAFVARSLAREPADRPADVAAFVAAGDAAFGRRPRVPARLLATAGIVATLVALGFHGASDPRAWLREGGLLAPVPVALAALALRWPVWSVAPAVAGLLGAAAGFAATMRAVAASDAAQRFVIFHVGLAESLANAWLGLGLAAAVLAGRAFAGPAPPAPPPRTARIAAGVALLALAAATLDPGALVVAGLAAAALALGRSAPGAVVLLAAAVVVRHEAATAGIWGDGLARGARADALVAAEGARLALAVSLAASVAVALARARRPRLGTVAALLLGAAGLVAVVARERAPLWDELAGRFSLWRGLDPPAGEGAGPARVGPTLQIGRGDVSLDGVRVAARAALASEAGRAVVAQALAARIAEGDPPDLVLAVDRRVPWSELRPVLALARDLGARTVDVLYSPGPPPDPRASAAAAFVLPDDLRALPIALGPTGDAAALAPAADASFDEIAARLPETPRLAP